MMKTTKSIMSMVLITAMSAVVIIFSACEKDKDTDLVDDYFSDSYSSEGRDPERLEDIALSPLSPSVAKVGQQIAFTVTGGKKPYQWSVSDTSVGTINPAETSSQIPQAVYTATVVAKNTVIVSDSQGRSAVKEIAASQPTLSIAPAAVEFLAVDASSGPAQQVQFLVTGGYDPVVISASHPTMGIITTAGLWTSLVTGSASTWSNTTITVTVVDATGASDTSTIKFK